MQAWIHANAKECSVPQFDASGRGRASPKRKLALMAGSNQTHIWEIENGGVSIGLDLLCRIADSLGVEVRALIEF